MKIVDIIIRIDREAVAKLNPIVGGRKIALAFNSIMEAFSTGVEHTQDENCPICSNVGPVLEATMSNDGAHVRFNFEQFAVLAVTAFNADLHDILAFDQLEIVDTDDQNVFDAAGLALQAA